MYSDILNYFRVSGGCPQIDTLIQQAQDFPTGEFDDIIDNVVMAFEHLPVKFIASWINLSKKSRKMFDIEK